MKLWIAATAVVVALLGAWHPATADDNLLRQWAKEAYASSQYSSDLWSAKQATGKPNTMRDGDHPTAWAPRSQDSPTEWLELVYEHGVLVSQVSVRETCNPGFVVKIEAYAYGDTLPFLGKLPKGATGWVKLWEGKDTTKKSPGVFTPEIRPSSFVTNRIRITINNRVRGWNEIDAVELAGRSTTAVIVGTSRQWASDARASSQYGTTDWSAKQATGAPDTMRDGDHASAWAPANKSGTFEWLELTYSRPAVPAEINIRETYNPGFVVGIEAYDGPNNRWVTLWKGEDTTATSPGVFSPPLTGNDFPTTQIRVSINTNVPGWNEIDAVELVAK